MYSADDFKQSTLPEFLGIADDLVKLVLFPTVYIHLQIIIICSFSASLFALFQWHAHIASTDFHPSTAISVDKFIGFKEIMYNKIRTDGKSVVKLEIWVDPNDDNRWHKAYQYTDIGGWGDAGQECVGSPDQIITWGGPLAIFRSDVDIKDFSVREIQPPT